MMKPEDIKKALECCNQPAGGACLGCPLNDKENCSSLMITNALSLINSLEEKYELAVKERETQYKAYFDTVNELNKATEEIDRLKRILESYALQYGTVVDKDKWKENSDEL